MSRRSRLNKLKFAAVLPLAAAMLPAQAQAFGFRTHLWIGQQIIYDLEDDCELTIKPSSFKVTPATCRSILAHRGEFLAGTLGPDVYPDLVTGQVTTHPGIPGDWQTSHWLKHVYETAPEGPELAFAAGYVVHTAGDIFAHTYVNAYAGDIYSLTDETKVELRHFLLEKYIDARLPPGEADPQAMRVPANWLASKLIFDEGAARNSAKSKIALHIPAMYAVWRSVSELNKKLEDLEDAAAAPLANLVAEHLELTGKVASGEAGLQALELGLAANQETLRIRQDAYNVADKALRDAIDAVDRNQDAITQSKRRAQLARNAIDEGRAAAESAQREIHSARERWLRLESELGGISRTIATNVCREVSKSCGRLPKPLKKACKKATKISCEVVEVTNDVWVRVDRERDEARRRVLDLEGKIQQAGITIAAETLILQEQLKIALEKETLRVGLLAARQARQTHYEAMTLSYETERRATELAQENVRKAREELEKLRNRLVNTEKVRDEVEALLLRSRYLSTYTANWKKGMDVSGAKLIEASLEASKLIASGKDGAASEYTNWLKCYGSAFTPVPFQVGEAACAAENFYTNAVDEFNRLVIRLLPPPLDDLYKQVEKLKQDLLSDVKGKAESAAFHLARVLDEPTGNLIELFSHPERATGSRLNDEYRSAGSAAGKKVLTYDRVTDYVDADLGLVDGRIPYGKFAALDYGHTLANLSLLEESELRRVARRFGSEEERVRTSPTSGRYSVLFDAPRSIDGNHQWQPYGLPYPRSQGAPEPQAANKREFGHGGVTGGLGFPFFVDPELRRYAFLEMFKKPVAGRLMTRPELNPPAYPFPHCNAHPFPVSFIPGGQPAESDLTCASLRRPDAEPPIPLGVRIKRFWYSIGDMLSGRSRSTRQQARFSNKRVEQQEKLDEQELKSLNECLKQGLLEQCGKALPPSASRPE